MSDMQGKLGYCYLDWHKIAAEMCFQKFILFSESHYSILLSLKQSSIIGRLFNRFNPVQTTRCSSNNTLYKACRAV